MFFHLSINRAIGELTQTETSEVLEGMTYYFFLELFKDGKTIDHLIDGLNVKLNNELLNNLYQKALDLTLDRLQIVSSRVASNVQSEAYKDFYTEFRKGLRKHGIRFDEDVLTKEEDSGTVNALGIRDTISIDPRKMTNTNIRLLLSSLPNCYYNEKGGLRPSLNYQGLPQLVDGDRVHTILLNELSNTVSYTDANGNQVSVLSQMFAKLDQKYLLPNGQYRNGYVWIKNLKLRLRIEDISGTPIPVESLTPDDIRLRIGFIKSFTNVKTVPQKAIVEEGGLVYNFNPVASVNTDRVRETWANNLKETIRPSGGLLKSEPDGTISFNRDSQQYKDLISLLNNPFAFKIEQALDALSQLGITFSAPVEDYATRVREHAVTILSLIKDRVINSVDDLYTNNIVEGRMKELLEIETRLSSEENILSYMNAEGKPQYSVGIPSLLSTMINILNSVGSLTELINSCPWLGTIVDGQPVLYGYNAGSQLLRPGGMIFKEDGSKYPGKALSYEVISGMGLGDVDGVNTADLQFPERVSNKIHYLLPKKERRGFHYTVFSNINSDKSTEFGIGFYGQPLFGENYNDPKAVQIYIDHLRDELYAAQLESRYPSNIQYYSKEASSLGHFRDILGDKLVSKFRREVLGDKPRFKGNDAYDKWLNANMADIQAAIERHIDKITNDTVSFLKDLDIFELAEQGMYITNAIDNKLLREFLDVWEGQTVEFIRDGETIKRPAFTENNLKRLAGYLAVKEEILITEQHKLLYGHPAFYKDLPKRANGATSTKEPIVDDPEIIQWMDNNMQRLDGKKRSEETHQTFSVISFKDQKVVSRQWKGIAEGMYQNMISSGMSKTEAENLVGARFNEDGTFESFILKDGEYTGHIKPYLELNEADAMAWGMPDIIRDMLFLSSKFTKEQEAQWNYEVAYEKVARSRKPKKHPAYKKYKPQELEAAQRIVEQGDPGYILQVLKPQYFGFAENDFMMHPVFLKHAVQPKFYRHVEGTQYENLYLAAQKNKTDIIGFESGEKVGNPTTDKGEFVDLYRPDGTINLTEDNDFPSELPKQKLYTRFYGIQVETPNVAKNAVVRGTQVTKLVMLNFFENGNPVSERAGELISEMNTTLERMMELGKDKLIKDLGLIKTEDGYKTWDLTRLVKTLRAECENRDLPDNAIDALNVLEDEAGAQHLLYKFDTLIHRDKIDSILNSIVDSRVISEKFHGKSSVQVASTGYESNPRNYVYLRDGVYHQLTDPNALTEEERKSIRMSSSDLQFYINKDGQITGMECYISWPFEGVTPEELGLEFKNGVYLPDDKIDSRLLKAIGFRIPTQGMNSIENIIIKGFTPAANGDMIVVPSEIVGKAGSNFDIDKRNLYLPNYSLEVYEKSYNSQEFKNFMLEDLQYRGVPRKDAERVMEAYTPKDFYMINRATYSDKGKEQKNAPYSLVDLVDNEVLDTVAFIKKSLSRYNRSVKSGKHLVYIEPGKDTKESLQNYYIDLMSELISLPENYRQLTTPNGAETLKALAKEVTDLKVKAGTKRKIDEKSFSYLRSFIGNTSIRERYLTAKRMVGIAALHNTFHAMAQVAGIKLSGQYKPVKYLSFGEESLPVKIKLTHTDPDENGHYPLGILSDKSGYYISDLFSEALTGFVDGAKDPFVFDLNFSMNTASTWFYLQHMGVPVDEVSYFMNQPVLDEYFDQFAKNRSNFKRANGSNLTREDLFLKVIEPYYKKLTGKDTIRIINLATGFQKHSLKEMFRVELAEIAAKYEQFGKKELLDNIRKGNNADPGMQIAVLMSYLEYEQQARQLSNFIRAIGYDNKKTRSIQENKMQVSNWERSKNEGFIQNPEDILKYTFIGEMKKHKEDVFEMFKEFFVTLSEEIQPAFQMLQNKIDDPDFLMAKDDMSNLITRYQNFIVGYLLHTSAVPTEDGQMSLNHRYRDMFFGENSVARKLLKLKEDINPAIRENRIIRELLPIISPDIQRPDSIKLFRSKMDTMSINNVIESLNELRHYALQTSDADLLQFTKDLAIFSILQSGVQNSTFDFRKALPTEIYSELVKEILERGRTNLDPNHIWDMFHQNNWNNRTIVPKAPSWLKIKNGVLKVKSTSPVTVNDFVLKYVRKSGLTYDQVRQMKAKAFEPVLFKKSHLEGDKWVYVPINRMGDGTRMLEVYTDKRESVLDKNRIGGGSIPVLPSGNQRPSTWYELFPNQKDRAEILSNFAKTHNLTLPEAYAHINAVVQDPDENLQDVVKKLKECYLLTTS